MKRFTLISLLLILTSATFAQDSTQTGRKWKLFSIGGGWIDGTLQYFNGYTYKVFDANLRSGAPRRADWDFFGNSAFRPTYYQAGLYLNLVNTRRKFRGRLTLSFAERTDTMLYQSMFTNGDTLYGRAAIEKVGFLSVGLGAMKTSRLLWKFLRIYGGGEFEFAFSHSSAIRYYEYEYDFENGRFTDYGVYDAKGKPRLDFYMSALVGVELCFLKRLGVTLEGKSGFGGHFILAEVPVGISKTVYMAGLNYYFHGYQD